MKIIDTHAHIYAKEFDEDRSEVLERAREVGVSKILMPNINAKSIEFMLQVEDDHPDYCIPMMGLHPCYVKEDFEKELYIVEDWLSKRDFVAVGEIGMDLHWDTQFRDHQEEAFKIQLDLAKKHQLPIAIHARNANREVLDLLKSYGEGLNGVFHCFSGTVEEGKEIIELGFYLGIGGVITFKNAGLDAVVSELGTEKMILETDCPYLAPVPYRGKRNEVSYLRQVANRVAEVTNKSLYEVESSTSKNACSLFDV